MHRRALLGAMALAFLAAVITEPDPASGDELSPTKTSATFELVPEDGLIRVTIDFEVTNLRPSETTREACPGYEYCEYTTDFYLTTGGFHVDPSGVDFSATTSGGAASVEVESFGEGFLSFATVTFPATFYGETRTVTLTYDVPGGEPRSGDPTRAGMAYANFCAIAGGAFEGDPESLRLVIPERYEVEQFEGDTLKRSTSDGNTILSTGEAPTPSGTDSHPICVEAQDDEAFVRTDHTSPGGIAVTIEAWPEDAEWQESVSQSVADTLGRLEEAIGRPPDAEEIVVREVLSESLGGYAAAFDPDESLARVGDDALDPTIAAHELAHAWFNESFTDNVWLNEGYAEVLAQSVVDADAPLCQDPGDEAIAGTDLAKWTYLPALPTEEDHQRVSDQYAISCWVVAQVVDRVGLDAMREILNAAWDGEIAYVGEGGEAEVIGPPPISWRDWLDLVDERGLVPAGETDLDWLQDLLVETGAAGNLAPLTERSAAREEYHALVAANEAWSQPIVIREALATWSFDDARDAISTGMEVVAAHESAVDLVPEMSESVGVEEAYEEATDEEELDEALRLATDEGDAAATVAHAVTAAQVERNPIELVGLVGADLEADASDAVTALVSSDVSAATELADLTIRTSRDAALSGGLRLGGFVAVITVAGGAYLLHRRRRRSRRPPDSPVGGVDEPAPTTS